MFGSLNEKRCPGLRAISYATPCRVFQAVPMIADGKVEYRPGKLLRVEKPCYWEQGMRPPVSRRRK